MATDRPFVLQWRSAVFASSLPSTAKLVLLTLAEFADRNGANCWPSLPMIAKRASLNERSVRRALDEVEPLGWIQRSKKGSERGWALSVYRLTIPAGVDTGSWVDATGADTESTPQDSTSGLSVTDVWTLCQFGVDTESNYLSSELSNTQPEENPSPEKRVSQKRGARAKLTFSAWRTTAEDPFTEGNRIDRYAEKVGLPDEFVTLAWKRFEDLHTNGPKESKKVQADWLATFENYLKGNYLRLWWFDHAEGSYKLNVTGVQAQREYGMEIQESTSRRHSAADDFRGKKYTGTPIDQLPADLREAARAALQSEG